MHSCYFNECNTMLSLLKDENLDYIFSLKLAIIKLIQTFFKFPYNFCKTTADSTWIEKYSYYIYYA